MKDWDPARYLAFGDKRTRAPAELVARVPLANPARIIDLGCGTGNSTECAARRWPSAAFIGLDSSPAMLAEAAKDHPDWTWQQGDIAAWAAENGPGFELIFSNAALQWLPDHRSLFPALMRRVAPGGALAVQMPRNFTAPSHTLMREVAAAGPWRDRLAGAAERAWTLDPADYYDLVAPHAAAVDIWESEYSQVMDGPDAIVDWVSGAGLRPYLDALDADERSRFIAEYRARIAEAYPRRADGRVLFPFRRVFIIATVQ